MLASLSRCRLMTISCAGSPVRCKAMNNSCTDCANDCGVCNLSAGKVTCYTNCKFVYLIGYDMISMYLKLVIRQGVKS